MVVRATPVSWCNRDGVSDEIPSDIMSRNDAINTACVVSSVGPDLGSLLGAGRGHDQKRLSEPRRRFLTTNVSLQFVAMSASPLVA